MALTEKEEIEYLQLLEDEASERMKARDIVPQDDDELWHYIRKFFNISIPRVAVCSHHQSPFQFVADMFFQREFNSLGFASRDSGKTRNMSILHQLNSHFKVGCDSCSVGAIELQAKKCYQYLTTYSGSRNGYFGNTVESSRIGDTIFKNGSKVSILPGTISAVNSPHPQVAVFDEVELTTWDVFQEFLNMAHSTKNIKAQNILISSRKFLTGTMQRIIDGGRFKVYQCCIFEVAENCKNQTCSACEGIIHGKWQDGTDRTFASVCNGRMRRSEGFIKKEDVHNRFMTLDRGTWETQQECLAPERSGLVYSWFERGTDGLKLDNYVGIYEGVDWGAEDPSVCLWGQKVGDEFWILDELYQSNLGVGDFISLILAKRLTEGYGDNIYNTFPDPSGKAARIDFENAGISTSIEFAKDVEYGIAVIKSLGEKGLIKISPKCVNLIRELGEYRKKPPKDGGIKSTYIGDDHACDAIRYLMLGIISQESGMPTIRQIGERL